ncbi:hypothetical protein [Ammoniphilus sp. 3BR4]|uniref:hypothetical protein n=1 Tax=Ammoniphilus sp. 3BR4 TaxID=3158265 RepID=UPI003466EDAA
MWIRILAWVWLFRWWKGKREGALGRHEQAIIGKGVNQRIAVEFDFKEDIK